MGGPDRAYAALLETAELPVVLVEVRVAGGAGRVEVGAPAGGDEVERSVVGHMPTALGVHGLEQDDGVEDLARRHAGGEAQGAPHVGRVRSGRGRSGPP